MTDEYQPVFPPRLGEWITVDELEDIVDEVQRTKDDDE